MLQQATFDLVPNLRDATLEGRPTAILVICPT